MKSLSLFALRVPALLLLCAACSDPSSSNIDAPSTPSPDATANGDAEALGADSGVPDADQPKGPKEITPAQIAIGDAHGCLMNEAHGVTCWGSSMHGESGAKTWTLGNRGLPTALEIFPPSSVMKIAAGGGGTCAVMNDSTVSCWGRLIFDNRLPPSMPTSGGNHWMTRFPFKVPNLTDVAEVVLHAEDRQPLACARTYAGAVHCWGDNYYGSLGAGDKNPKSATVLVIPSGATALAKGHGLGASIYALVNGGVQVWGQDKDYIAQKAHGLAGLETNVVAISSSCAIKNDGSVWCWKRGLMAPNKTEPTIVGEETVEKVEGLPANVTRLATSGGASCALVKDGTLYCWGKNEKGQVGAKSDAPYVSAPTKIELPGFIAQIEPAGEPGFCAFVKPNATSMTGKPYCWGANDHGRVGLPLASPTVQGMGDIQLFVKGPNEVAGLELSVLARSLSFDIVKACGVSSNGIGRCWRDNVLVERTRRRAPTTFGAANLVQIEQQNSADGAICALDAAGSVTCQEGFYDYDFADVTLTVPAKKIALAKDFACAIRKDNGGIACWGKATKDSQFAAMLANLGSELTSGVKDLLYPGGERVCAITAASDLRCFGREPLSTNLALPTTVQTNVDAIAPNSFCVKTKAGTVLCPVRDTHLKQWTPSNVQWSVHEAWLDYGREVHDY